VPGDDVTDDEGGGGPAVVVAAERSGTGSGTVSDEIPYPFRYQCGLAPIGLKFLQGHPAEMCTVSGFIYHPPALVWVRGVPTRAPIPAIEVMYRRAVYVVTGSGIGPMLGLILNRRVPSRLVWSTRSPRATYGDALVDEVLTAILMWSSGTLPSAASRTCWR
jgi:hypothetical protein